MRKLTLLAAALTMAACGGNEGSQNTVGDTAAGGLVPTPGADTGAAVADTGAMRTGDTAAGARRRDTSRDTGGAVRRDTAANQSQAGVTNAKTGKSTLGPDIKKTRPDQGATVTSKGDTVRKGGDTTRKRPPR